MRISQRKTAICIFYASAMVDILGGKTERYSCILPVESAHTVKPRNAQIPIHCLARSEIRKSGVLHM